MSTYGAFNSKSPTMRRILKEASELATNPSIDYHASPLEDNLFEWHFTLRGPPAPSPYASGLYHGRIILPTTYPLRPPSFRFLTPSGRFEVNRELCLSISGHHEETWQPAWGIRTALVAIRSFMVTDAKGQLGGLECDEDARRKMAVRSLDYTCLSCHQKSNRAIMQERALEVAKLAEEGMETKEEDVPDELRLAYREDLGPVEQETGVAQTTAISTSHAQSQTQQAPSRTEPIPTIAAPFAQQQARRAQPSIGTWVDMAIYGIAAVLAILVARKVLAFAY